jgi:hypothetical protein
MPGKVGKLTWENNWKISNVYWKHMQRMVPYMMEVSLFELPATVHCKSVCGYGARYYK